ncbi:MAG: type II toxin-antitoxin system RelE/ParE family toxin [Thaumarchaeota archaeon]|nr:type II toxin-antitoxin system RelE/ParE family toxin [Nitrososphaerota archaeon]
MRFIDESELVKKKLKKFKSDKAVILGYYHMVEDLINAPDPARIGERKHGIYRNCHAIHITKNHSILYRYLPEQDIVQIIDLDDHKNLYGRDNRG